MNRLIRHAWCALALLAVPAVSAQDGSTFQVTDLDRGEGVVSEKEEQQNASSDHGESRTDQPVRSDGSGESPDETPADAAIFDLSTEALIHREVLLQEESPWAIRRPRTARTGLPPAAMDFSTSLFGGGDIAQSMLPARRQTFVGIGVDAVASPEAATRGTTDVGSLLGKSPSTLGLGIQRRNPIITDPRIRGSRIGRLAGSGSYWVPARMDLDTVLSKIDSRIINDVITVKGPYAARYGPGFSHVDFDLLATPRYDDGFNTNGLTSFDYKANGQQWYGQQMVWGGTTDWGFRAGYGHRTGNDYTTGQGLGIPSSYNSRTFDLALGRDLSPDRHIEFTYLRLDQTNIELPGQAFDIDFLVTDGYEMEYVVDDPVVFDQVALDMWYNQTRFDGSAQRPGKRRQFPYYDFIGFVGNTDVDSLSTGYRLTGTWGCSDCEYLDVGLDLRYVKQELNEITSGRIGFNIWTDANSPVPKSYLANPGLFLEYHAPLGDLDITAGTRVDIAATDVTDDPAKLASLGTQSTPGSPISLGDILGTDDFTRTEALGAAYVTGDYAINACWSAQAAVGYAERSPTLTELYAAETFMFVLQNGLNTVTGDPRLEREKLLQLDLGLTFDTGRFRGGITGFHGWAWDYVTFENVGIVRGPPAGQVEQVQLKYVNTDLATLTGAEVRAEFDVNGWLTPFATFTYMDGRDRTRDGDFATIQSAPGSPSTRDYSRSRGFYSGIPGSAEEPLPSIVPLESRLGIRIHQPADVPLWGLEVSARIVDDQDRVATSLLETPTAGFAVWDLRGYWRATDRLLMIAGVENLGNRTYREHLDFRSASGIQMYQPGANFYVGGELNY